MVAGASLALLAGSVGHGAATPQKVDDFQLPDQNYVAKRLHKSFDAKAVVLISYQAGDAAIKADAPAYKALKDAYGSKGVEFLMIDSRLGETRETVAADTAVSGLGIPILFDYEQLVGEGLDLTRAAEVIIVNPKDWTVAFRGPVGHASTRRALDALVDGKTIALPAQAPKGGAIAFPMKAMATTKTTEISYARDIAPIVQAKCVTCHQAGGLGPMALTNYDQIKAHSPMIREVLRTHRMPPFQPDPTVGHWAPNEGLSSEQLKTMVHWIESGSPRGAGDDPLAKQTFTVAPWPLPGTPDVVLSIPEVKVPATGVMAYQNPVVSTNLTEGRWMRASAFQVSDRAALHHVTTVVRAPNESGAMMSLESGSSSIGGQGPGRVINLVPQDMGVWVPAGSVVAFSTHYTPYGRETTEKTNMGLYFYPKGETPKYPMRTYGIYDMGISIPAGVEYHPEVAYTDIPKDMLLYGITPHAHMRGGSTQVSIKYPDGHEQMILAVPHYNFEWQCEFYLEQPIMVPAGSRIINRWTYDNTVRNTGNPAPDKTITFGEQSWEEMLVFFLHYRWVGETTAAMHDDYDRMLSAGQTMGALDDNMDGKLQVAELRGTQATRLKAQLATLDTNKDGALDRTELAAAGAGGRGDGGAAAGRGQAATTPAPSATAAPRPSASAAPRPVASN
ncbi:MAG: hypothetical protein WCI21_01500 [Alphaproteobacteria bacterium]